MSNKGKIRSKASDVSTSPRKGPNVGKIRVRGIQCPRCHEKVASLYRHDFKYCGCGYCFIDGGQEDYYRIGYGVGLPEDMQNDGNVPNEVWDKAARLTAEIGPPKEIKFYITGIRIRNVDGFPGYEQTLLEAYKDVSKEQPRNRN